MTLAKTLQNYGVQDLILDPGTFFNEGLADTLNNFTMLRRSATKEGNDLAGFPLLGLPLTIWANKATLLTT
jgi:acetyl-CoA decarbonylase/synthase complex subunit gamma